MKTSRVDGKGRGEVVRQVNVPAWDLLFLLDEKARAGVRECCRCQGMSCGRWQGRMI